MAEQNSGGSAFTEISLTHVDVHKSGTGQRQRETESQRESLQSETADQQNLNISHSGPEGETQTTSVDHNPNLVSTGGESSTDTRDDVAKDDPELYGIYHFFKHQVQDFYSTEDGALEAAVKAVTESVYDKEIDGENILGSWLLMEVDHWDNETEKVVVLTDESLLSVRYDFVPKKVYKHKRVALKDFDTVQTGNFQYPDNSLLNLAHDLKKRTIIGTRLMWNKGVEPGFFQRWKPSSESMPWQIYTHHPIGFTPAGSGRDVYNVEHFVQAAIGAITKAYSKHSPDRTLAVKEEPIYQSIYFGLSSQIHNQSFLGMSKNRGPLSF